MPEEKGSDVNLAVSLVHDAHLGRFDRAAVISNDSDLEEALRVVKDECGKEVYLLSPVPRQPSKHLVSEGRGKERQLCLWSRLVPSWLAGFEVPAA